MTEKIVNYLSVNNINLEDISKDLGISREKLQSNSKLSLSAEEFLSICCYLHIRPENFIDNSARK